MIQIKQNTFDRLLPVYGDRESNALIRALQEDLFSSPKTILDEQDLVTWNQAVHRLLLNEPVAYITGKAYFLHLKLKVNRHVLIPRPETESLVVYAIQLLQHIPEPRVLDIGTGSGCIALAIKSSIKESLVFAMDVDEQTLDVAEENAAIHNQEVTWIHSDIRLEDHWNMLPTGLDLIISNPPYILDSEKELMSASALQYEPPLALFAGDDPVFFYKIIARLGLRHLKTNGRVLVEINEFLADETKAVFELPGYSKPELIQDLSGKDRILSVVKLI